MPKRRASPAPDRINDLDLSRWREYDDVFTDSLWLFESRGRANGHDNSYHGNYIPQIATQILTRYTREDDVVVDFFLGSGTTALEAAVLNRRCIGVELNPKVATSVRAKLRSGAARGRTSVVTGDSASAKGLAKVRERLASWERPAAQLAVLHPPYDDIIRFSDNPSDLSNCETTDAFLDRFELVARNAWEVLDAGRYAVLVIGDKYCNGELVPLGFRCMERMNAVGFTTKSIIVKNIEGNERGKGKTQNLWRYRALQNGFYIFKHEYVMVFHKPAKRRK